jgi:nucleoside-diphosphate-sugar epimerase
MRAVQHVFVTGGSGFVGRALLAELRRRQIPARALARSDAAAAAVAALGAAPVRGELDDAAAMQAGMAGCDLVVHAAAWVKDTGTRADFHRANVVGTERALAAARAAGVARFVHVGTEAVLADGRPIIRADETRPLPARPAGLYPWSKGLAERAVRAASTDGFATVVVRPRFIWGAGDSSVLPRMVEVVRAGGWRWIGGGHYLTSTCHVDNVVEGILLAAERGRPGAAYFLTDGAPVEFRAFVGDLLRAAGADPGEREVPRWGARVLAAVTAWQREPRVTRTALALMSHEVTVDDGLARRELGYVGRTSIADGLAGLRAAAR